MKQPVTSCLTTLAVAAALTLQPVAAQNDGAAGPKLASPAKYNDKGELMQPRGFREWVFIGSPLTPNALNGGSAGFPEFHNVYVSPAAYRHYQRTGEWPEGTVLVKELQLTRTATYADGSRNEPSGRGYFPSTPSGLDVSVKDSERFAATSNWGFFNFGHHAPPYAGAAQAAPKDACAGCHMSGAHEDMVFSDFYQQLKPLPLASQ
ncbi:MAG: cytochrome P460 family protein [Gammaproteobacteria bacterium]|nr:cytochrome P460 family protein [Gammaproteobacteria bacterium]